ncbi:hypothetical protein FHS38_006920 [Streptomyces netropsis]|uniref:Uncharacterized protein n=1 Tax=Streptomyces netropsis TaxID=55404 RepID=A0A7W7LID7_STRNE|nr:hypothetical protein [Streptomyces netropsis]MBB4890828.1 hypothetical protein [Streptomyces netropsis]GGR50976.1 hypothetical protein GCM10010219_65240 [Streptomyces netropsis]
MGRDEELLRGRPPGRASDCGCDRKRFEAWHGPSYEVTATPRALPVSAPGRVIVVTSE